MSVPVAPHAFTSALSALMPELRGQALRLTGSKDRADDIVQDALERCLRFHAHYREGTNLRAWAKSVLFRVFVTRYRSARRARRAIEVLARDPLAWTSPVEAATPDRALPLPRRLRDRLDGLPDGYRDVIAKVDLEDLSYREAADALGVPLGTVMSRLHRGRKLLATAMSDELAA